MNGLTCLKQLQLKTPSEAPLRVVIVTALNDSDKKREALANGAEAYVLKPICFNSCRNRSRLDVYIRYYVKKSNWTMRQPSSTPCAVSDSSLGNSRTEASVSLGVALA